jgi:hypothetical protein
MVQGSGLWSDWENKVKEAGERDSRKGFVSWAEEFGLFNAQVLGYGIVIKIILAERGLFFY